MDKENLKTQSNKGSITQLNAKSITGGSDGDKQKKPKKTILKSKKSKIIAASIVVVVGLVGFTSYSKAQKAKIKEVSLTTTGKASLTQSVTLTGSIEANSRNEISLAPTQKVVEVLVKEGQTVKKGDILVKLDVSDLKSQLEKQNLNLANAEYNLNHLISNSSVKDKVTSENAVKQAKIALETAKINLEDAKKKFEQNKQLFEGGYISANDFDAIKNTLTANENALKNAEITLSNAQSTYSNIDATVNNQITNQRNQIAMIKADIENLNTKIEDCNLKATVAGKVTKIDAKVNQYPVAGDKIIIDDVSLYKASMDVSQYDAINMKKGQKAIIKVNGANKEYAGVITDIGQLAEKKATSTDQDSKVNVKVSINKPDANVKVGYEVDAEIILNEKQNALQIGFEAVKEDNDTGKKYVFVVDENNIVAKRYITTGLETDYNIEVLSGLKEGEKYVLSPEKTLAEGDKVSETKVGSKATK